MAANCPECDSLIDIDEMDVEVGDELSCSECGALIRVASESPLEFELADDEDEEDDDYDDENDEGDEDDEDVDDDDLVEDTEDEE